MPGRSRSAQILESGTVQQKQWLSEAILASMTPEARDKAEQMAQAKLEHARKVNAPARTDSAETALQKSVARMKSLMSRGMARKAEDVDGDTVIAAKRLLWEAYSGVVFKGRATRPVIEPGGHIATVLAASAYWLLGIEAPEGVQGFDPRKSLYFAGDTGNGKSSIAKAIHFASTRLSQDYQTGEAIGIRSMKRVVTDIFADNNLSSIKELSDGSLVLDEIRTEHIVLKHYGNEISIVSDVLYNRYDSWDFDGHQTIITTNLTPKALCADLNDQRLRARIYDQYQLVKFTGAPFRDTEISEF